ncbi:HNH endonuclease [Anaeromyxobacter diazotrophicus]|uniref:HNH nuclease domain-containing protein n=1 Tax=Anaeromyxobacter diazotrophicus TaxID=2590199 RepID=A0A7I9VL48_9BACT|nr:HNH endonuclease signature motif containing protein [Anaeromyxobacter diazotrophicus]GEJ56829.1 hypothetical protein AMYX_15700 [Anaeromyxobacter diazotrophicus]
MTDAKDLSRLLADLLRREQHALADFLVALSAFDRERRWLELGYTSCFYFLHRELGLSKGAAFYRKTAAELLQSYPELIEPLRDGRLCLSNVAELAKVITPENRAEVVPRFFHASKQEAKEVAAELRPAEVAPRREVVTAVRCSAARAAPELVSAAVAAPASAPAAPQAKAVDFAQAVHPENQPERVAAPSPDEIEPLTAELRRLHFTVSKRFLAKLAAARDALSHSHPGASTEAVLEAGLDLLLAAKAKRKGLVAKPRETAPRLSSRPRHTPAAVKRAVWARDGGCCQWPVASGGVCGSTTRLELDHVLPVARGGESTVENLRVVCRVHNQLAAREFFGVARMARFAAKAPPHASAPACAGGGGGREAGDSA